MDRLFEERRLELEREYEVSAGLFDESLSRLAEFKVPFVTSLARSEQRHYAQTVVQGLCSDLDRKNIQHFK